MVDATHLERNLNLVLAGAEITDRAVVCVNLMDEADRKGMEVDVRSLSRDLGVPAVPTVARNKQGLAELVASVAAVVSGETKTSPLRVEPPAHVREAINGLVPLIEDMAPGLPARAGWRCAAGRRSQGEGALLSGEIAGLADQQRRQRRSTLAGSERSRGPMSQRQPLRKRCWTAATACAKLGGSFRDEMVASLYEKAGEIAVRSVHEHGSGKWDFDQRIDRIVTSRWLGLPVMLLLLGAVFWVTILGANVPSQMLANALFAVEGAAASWFESMGSPWWLTGLVWHGVFRGLAWVVSVMLPPMAIFFPVFTILEDLGYLPRVAFNSLLFRKLARTAKQASEMAMASLNAAGVTSTRINRLPRERPWPS